MNEYERVREAIARKIPTDCEACDTPYCGNATDPINYPCLLQFQVADQILSLVEIRADDQSLPEIPEFQYDEPEKREWLKRGAINYSKMLSNFVRVIPKRK